jgi:heme/copper-type cytochrome/quinol oxidase subunit 2
MEVRRPPTAASLLPIADSNGLSFPGSQVSSKPVWVDIVVVIVVILLAVGAMVMGIAWRRRRRSRKRNDNPVELAHLIPLDSQRS